MAWGAGIKRGAQVPALQIYDLVPTALHTLGISADEPFDGRVAQEIFADRDATASGEGNDNLVARKLRLLHPDKATLH